MISKMSSSGGKHSAIQADISKAADVARLFEAIESKYGRLDVLVNNAGVNRDGSVLDMTEAMWDEVVDTNLKGAFLCSRMAAALMLRQKSGTIVNISAESAIRGRAGACNYIAAKAGLIGLTKALARELAPHIRVNCVALGLVETEELVERLALHRAANRERFVGEIPLGRIGTVQEVSKVILFLASQDSSYVTGQVVAVGGGRWM